MDTSQTELNLTKPLKWQYGNVHYVGRAARVIQRTEAGTSLTLFYHDDCLLVKHAHTGELELVPLEELTNYEIHEEYRSP